MGTSVFYRRSMPSHLLPQVAGFDPSLPGWFCLSANTLLGHRYLLMALLLRCVTKPSSTRN